MQNCTTILGIIDMRQRGISYDDCRNRYHIGCSTISLIMSRFHACGKKLMRITESMIGVDFSALSDAELVQVLYSKISMQTLHLLQDDMQLLHMLLKNDSGT